MKTAKVYYKTKEGKIDYWVTDINGTEESIKQYFLTNYFNVGVYPVEYMVKPFDCIVY